MVKLYIKTAEYQVLLFAAFELQVRDLAGTYYHEFIPVHEAGSAFGFSSSDAESL